MVDRKMGKVGDLNRLFFLSSPLNLVTPHGPSAFRGAMGRKRDWLDGKKPLDFSHSDNSQVTNQVGCEWGGGGEKYYGARRAWPWAFRHGLFHSPVPFATAYAATKLKDFYSLGRKL